MLLRRVIEHVKAQNWTAVALDFLIVVVGVFIGIQVANLNEARLAEKDGKTALERLHAEAEEIVDYFQKLVTSHNKRNEERTTAIAALSSGSLEGFNPDTVQRGLFSLGNYRAISPKRSTYDELSASGQLANISDPAVRESIASYYAEYDFIQSQLVFFRQSSQRDDAAAGTAIGVKYNPGEGRVLEPYMDFEALAGNEVYVHAATASLRNQFVFQSYRRRILREAKAMCRELSRAAGKECSPLADDTPAED